jgi:hypothetical protein
MAPMAANFHEKITIDDALDGFLDSRRSSLAPRTFRRYEEVVELLAHCLNGYGHASLSELERKRLEEAYAAGGEEAFCHLFGPEKIVDSLGEFLGYFMIHKVAAGQELLRASGTVTKQLAGWLHQQGWIDDDALEIAVERATDAARDLPKADKLSGLLYDLTRRTPHIGDPDVIADEDWVEDFLPIERVEPGALWFEGGIGPLKVPRQASALAQAGWSVNVVLVRLKGVWHLLEVGNVYP